MFYRSAPLLVSLLALSLPAAAQVSSKPTNPGLDKVVLEGSVITLDNHPVADARVKLREITSSASVTSTYTNSRGIFEFDDLAPGKYDLAAYTGLGETHEQLVLRGPSNNVVLRLPERTSRKGAGNATVSLAHLKVPSKARDALHKAQRAVDKRDFAQAQHELAKALSIYPQYAEAITLRGILKLDSNDATGAIADLDQAVKWDPGYALAYLVMGAAFNVLTRYDDAVRSIERATTLAPTLWQAYFEMGKAYIGKGDFATALQQLNKAESLAPPSFALIHLVKAHALLGMKDYGNAMTELEAYLSRDPGGPNSQNARKTLEKVRAFTGGGSR